FVMREKILREERQKTQEIASKQSSIQQSKKQYANNTIENNFQKLQATIFAPQNHLKARSILLTCLEELIRTTEANEFDPFSWKVKVDSNDSLVGGRILLSDISIYKTDIDGLYRPLIDSLSRKFSKSQLSIQTKTKSHDGVITLLDVTITVPLISIVQEVGEIRS
ncbi:MAG: hypothetical protein HON90_17255, partial [Halobacteriovoraceae bacterium]|nr:hypothetical protein [Halobacteriovoraceae bacterium]